MGAEEVRFDLPHIRLNGKSIGTPSPDKTCVLFLHGWLDNAASFDSLIAQIGDHLTVTQAQSCYLLSLDLAGHGLSAHKSIDNFYAFHEYIIDLDQLLKQLDYDRLILVGHSLGSLISAAYASAFPDKVTGLVLIEGLLPLHEAADKSAQRLRMGLASIDRALHKKTPKGYTCFEQGLLHRSQHNLLPAELIEPIVRRGLVLNQVTHLWQWRYDSKLKANSLYRMTQAQAVSLISDIRSPCLIVLGESGFFPKDKDAHFLLGYNVLHNADYAYVKGGHHCHLESPMQVASLLVEFIFEKSTL